nr:type II toxin-antitoxin system prevent-host-death family antitoxin [Curtobacterium sp. MCBD17_013]
MLRAQSTPTERELIRGPTGRTEAWTSRTQRRSSPERRLASAPRRPAQPQLPEMIEDVQAGAEYVITNHGHEVARVVPTAADTRWTHNRERVDEVLERVADPELAAFFEEGRRSEVRTDR